MRTRHLRTRRLNVQKHSQNTPAALALTVLLQASMGVDDGLPQRPPTFENGQDIRDRAFEFGCRVVKFCQQLSDSGGVGRLMVPQLLSCSLSCATMLEEAR